MKQTLLLIITALFLSVAIAQDENALLRDLVDAHFGDYSRLSLGTLPEAFEFEVPEGITVLGHITEGYFSDDDTPIPPSYGSSQYYNIYLKSTLSENDLGKALEQAFIEELGFQSMYTNNYYSPEPITWGFVENDYGDYEKEDTTYPEDYSSFLYGSYCNEGFSLNFNPIFDEGVYDFSEAMDESSEILIQIYANSMPSPTACEEEIAYNNALDEEAYSSDDYYEELSESVENIPGLKLLPPMGSLSLVNENIPYFPTPSSRISGIKISSAWTSRTVLGTPIMGEDLRLHYDKQLKDQGWQRIRAEVSGPLAWSEWTIKGKDGKQWGGLLQVMSDSEWQKGVAMPIFFLLEKP